MLAQRLHLPQIENVNNVNAYENISTVTRITKAKKKHQRHLLFEAQRHQFEPMHTKQHYSNFVVIQFWCEPSARSIQISIFIFISTFFVQVITIFSASNYYEIGSNKGAYLKLNPQLDTHFVQYTAAASKTRKLTFRQKVGLVESSAIRELGAKLRERRGELEREFKARDPDLKGTMHRYKVICFRSGFSMRSDETIRAPFLLHEMFTIRVCNIFCRLFFFAHR